MVQKMSSFVKVNLLALWLILSFILEGVYKYLFLADQSEYRILAILNASILIAASLYLLWNKHYKALIVCGVLSFFTLIGYIVLTEKVGHLEQFTMLGRYLFPLVVLAFSNIFTTQKIRENLIRAFEIIILLNIGLIILGAIFKIDYFSTYNNMSRFGFNGMLLNGSKASYIYTIALMYFTLFRNYKSTWRKVFTVLIVLLGVVLLGTKTIYIGVATVVFAIFYKRFGYVVSAIASLAIVALGVAAITQSDLFSNAIQVDGFWSPLLSYRDVLLTQNLLPFIDQHWTFINYLFGGYGGGDLRSQFGLIDLFFYFGIIGTIIYVLQLFFSFFNKSPNSLTVILCAGILIQAMLSGNFFFNASITIYILIFQQILQLKKTSQDD